MDPVSSFAAGINSSIKILEVSYQLKSVDEQTTDLLRTTEHVNRNVKEARRLCRLKASLINTEELSWMNGVIVDTEKALLGVAQLIEPARVDSATTKSVNSKTRILWVFRDSPRVRDKHNRLSVCHQSLLTIINALYAKDVVVVAPFPVEKTESQPPPYSEEMEAMFKWRSQQRRRRKSTANLKVDEVGPTSPRSESDSLSSPQRSTHTFNPDPNLSSPEFDVVRPHPASPGNHAMSSTAVPSAFYTSFDGADGLQLQNPYLDPTNTPTLPHRNNASSRSAGATELWSPITLLPSPSVSPFTAHAIESNTNANSFDQAALSSNTACVAEKSSGFQTEAHDLGLQELGTYPAADNGIPSLSRAGTRTRGQRWLACYAARSELGSDITTQQRYL